MVRGYIAYDNRLLMVRIQGIITIQRYMDDVLWLVTLLFLRGTPYALHQQDDARPTQHDSEKNVHKLPRPQFSPDISPIDKIWDAISN
ncbi:hypothetical protein TNCV_4942581 [Trichonephila clavipes]|nr:hypothetical protein TNCV_4942581 [Trichonephila clavipes]